MTEHILADITRKRADSYFHANSDVLKQMDIVVEQQQLEKRNQQAAAQQQKIAASASNNNNGPDICMCAHCVEQMNKHLQWEQQQQQKAASSSVSNNNKHVRLRNQRLPVRLSFNSIIVSQPCLSASISCVHKIDFQVTIFGTCKSNLCTIR